MALSIVPIGGALGLSVDLGRAYLARTHLQDAVDAAALAGVLDFKSTQSVATAEGVAKTTLAAILTERMPGAATTATMNVATNTLSVSASYNVNTSFIRLVSPGQLTTPVIARAAAVIQDIGLGKNLEVSVMLDVTTSMTQSSGTSGMTKLQAMQTSAKNLVDTLVQTTQTPYSSRVALVPFSAAVNVGSTYFATINGSSPSGSWTSVVERAGAYNATDDSPASAKFPSYKSLHGSAKSPNSYIASIEKNRTSNTPSTAVIKPLSSDKVALKAAVNAFSADGTTAGHIGTGWAWYMLSPKWTSIWTGVAKPAPYGPDVSKVAVLMSDFDYNVYYQGGVGDMNAQAAALCANMKAAGITVYTIGFQVDHNLPKAVSLFRNCASDPAKAIEAQTGAEMIAAFESVSKTVLANISSPVRLAR